MTSQHRAVKVTAAGARRLQANVARAAQPELELVKAMPFREALQALLASIEGAYVGALELSDRGGRSCTVIYVAPVPHGSLAATRQARVTCWEQVQAACAEHRPAWTTRIEGHGAYVRVWEG